MKLYLLVSDSGDGSYHVNFVNDESVIERMQQMYNDGKLDYENGWGIDGDGFHYKTLTLPELTLESMGISRYSVIKHSDLDETDL